MLDSRQELVEGLLELALRLTSDRPLGERLDGLCRSAVALLECDRSSIFLLERGCYRARYNWGNPPDIAALFPQVRVPLRDPLASRVLETRQVVVVNHALDSEFVDREAARAARVRAIAVAPLLGERKEPAGFMTAEFGERDGAISDMMAGLLLGLAKLADLALVSERRDRERRRSEAALQEARDRLAARVRERTADLEAAAHRLRTETSERRAVEEDLLRSKRLAGLGTVAAGIAHDINNPLSVILLTAQEALEESGPNAGCHAALHRVVEQARRCRAIVGGVLKLARDEPADREPTDLNEIVHRAVGYARAGEAPAGVDFRLELAAEPPVVVANALEVEQALVNLLRNAAQASPSGSAVTVSTDRTGDAARVAVIDRGRGIAEADRSRIFQPFFTTRRTLGGSGLGLSIARRIVRDHAGQIRVASEPGAGTTVQVELPLAGAERSATA